MLKTAHQDCVPYGHKASLVGSLGDGTPMS